MWNFHSVRAQNSERAFWSFHREMISFRDWDACCHKQGLLSSFVPIGTVKAIPDV